MAEVKRVHIVGGPGTGKSMLAAQVAEILGVLPTDLSQFATELSGLSVPFFWRSTLVKDVALQRSWVTEGEFIGWTEALMDEADVIVWLDYRPTVAIRQVLARHILMGLRRRNRHPGLLRLLRFLAGARHYYSEPLPKSPDYGSHMMDTRALTAWVLRDFRHKLVVCKTRSEAAAFVQSLALAPTEANRS